MVISNIYWKPEIDKGLTYFQLEYTGCVSLSQSRWVFPFGTFPIKLDYTVGGRAQNQRKINLTYKKNSKKFIRMRLGEWGSRLPKFIVIESLEDACQAKFSHFLRGKVIAMRATHQNVKKTQKRNLLVEMDSQMQAENILKMKSFHTTKYLHKRLNTSKGVIRSRELALASENSFKYCVI